jgi:hypothetical protein
MPKHFSTIWKIHYIDQSNGMHEIAYVETETLIQAVAKLENLFTQKPNFTYPYIERLTLIK